MSDDPERLLAREFPAELILKIGPFTTLDYPRQGVTSETVVAVSGAGRVFVKRCRRPYVA